MFSRIKIQALFWIFVVAVTLGVAFVVFSPPYSASFLTTLGFVILAESLILLIPLEFQSEQWCIRILFVGAGAILYALLVAAVSVLGFFKVPFDRLLALHLLILLVPGLGMTAAALMLRRMHGAVSDIEARRKLFVELNAMALRFDVRLKGMDKPEFATIFSKAVAKISAMPKETAPEAEAVTRQIVDELDALAPA